jgi:hypothetical protein
MKVSDMTPRRISELRFLEGRRVSLALTDGSILDDCQLVSVGRRSVNSVWLFTNGTDTFIPLTDVIDCWAVG